MDIDSIRVFCAAVEFGSIAAAAREIGTSASMASRRISSLEEELGAPLLLRTTRSLVPTDAGTTLLEWARSALSDWNRVRDEIGAMHGQAAGLVRLATNDYAASTFLPKLLASFATKQPGIRIAISIAQEPATLLAGSCDIAVHAGRRPDADLVGRRLYEYARRLVASPDYLSRQGTPRKPSDLSTHRCLAHTVSEPTEWTFEARDGSLKVHRVHAHLSCDSWTMLLALAEASVGIARLSDSLVQDAIEEGRLVELLPDMRCVYADGDPPAMWVLLAQRDVPLRIRLLADHIAQGLIDLRKNPGR